MNTPLSQYKPLNSHVIVRRDPVRTESAGGIILGLDGKKGRSITGTVLSVGSGKTLYNGTVVPIEVKVGDRIMIHKFSGTDMKLDDEEVVIIDQDDIVGIFED